MIFKIIIDTDSKQTTFTTIKVIFENSIEYINRYTVTTEIIRYDNSILYKKSEIMNHNNALKFVIALKNTQDKNIVGIDFISKQTFITKKNPYIPRNEYIKRFLWE